ncbi:MAG: hypothetical protein EBR09_11535, partial [Proteobacteria bacterium]|nr:hypothetical protein [Pseudomonadota bacterium]
ASAPAVCAEFSFKAAVPQPMVAKDRAVVQKVERRNFFKKTSGEMSNASQVNVGFFYYLFN